MEGKINFESKNGLYFQPNLNNSRVVRSINPHEAMGSLIYLTAAAASKKKMGRTRFLMVVDMLAMWGSNISANGDEVSMRLDNKKAKREASKGINKIQNLRREKRDCNPYAANIDPANAVSTKIRVAVAAENRGNEEMNLDMGVGKARKYENPKRAVQNLVFELMPSKTRRRTTLPK